MKQFFRRVAEMEKETTIGVFCETVIGAHFQFRSGGLVFAGQSCELKPQKEEVDERNHG